MHGKGVPQAMPLLTSMVFLGAFLLFTMEPYIGRLLVPFFGGSVHVWLICLTFFQLMLLVGYGYAYLAAKTKGCWHILLLLVPFVTLPFEIAIEDPLRALAAILARFALPFLILSATAVVAQSWLARTRAATNPYPLYGAANAGALLAVAAYPLLVEPLLGLRWQAIVWTVAYALFVLLAALAWLRVKDAIPEEAAPAPPLSSAAGVREEPSRGAFLYWAFLSFITSALLVTVTRVIAGEAGSFPLVWLLPLAVYLVSFMATFREGGRVSVFLGRIWPEITLAGLFLYLVPSGHFLFLLGHLFVLLGACLLVHAALYGNRPRPERLSTFYLAIALGGFAGSAIVTLAAPLIFSRFWEYPLLLALLAVFFRRHYGNIASFRGRVPFFRRIVGWLPAAALSGLIIFLMIRSDTGTVRALQRNFYGQSRVLDSPLTPNGPAAVRSLVHGSTVHGVQFLDPEKRRLPTLYYHGTSGLADTLAALPRPARIAAIGLGTGTVAAYTRPGDILDFYELDPSMEHLARRWFTYLADAGGRIRVTIGDGRVALRERSGSNGPYDLIFIDAFSGEGIPAHLLTEEALAVYLGRLAAGGIVLFHLTNRYYDLRPILKAAAARRGLHGAMKSSLTPREESGATVRAVYLALTREPSALEYLPTKQWIALGEGDGLRPCHSWTDDYVNILVPLAARLDVPVGEPR